MSAGLAPEWVKKVVRLDGDAGQRAAWNVDGSASDKIETSWIRFWEELTKKKRSICSYEGCNWPANHGGHVWIRYRGVHIVPICAQCNDCNNPERMQAKDANHSRLRCGILAIQIMATDDIRNSDRRVAAAQSSSDTDDDSSLRYCKICRVDISRKPPSHTLCSECWGLVLQDSDTDSRCCHMCGADISDRPESHALCLQCFRGQRRSGYTST
eukprot:SAG31_NODE_9893_length_1215_cov_1.122760_1_plen_212_part_10